MKRDNPFGIRVGASDYCVSCGTLMEPWGLVGRSDRNRRKCSECSPDETPIVQSSKRPANAQSTPQGAGGWCLERLKSFRTRLTAECRAFWRRLANPENTGFQGSAGFSPHLFARAAFPELVQATALPDPAVPCGPVKSLPFRALRSAHSTTLDESGVRDAHAVDLKGNCPEWVELIPAGEFTGRDGRGPYTNRDPHSICERSMQFARDGVLMIDVGHELEEKGVAGNAAEAAGWITELQARDGGSIWGKVEWTSLGKDKVGGKLLRWLSPVFYHDGSANAQKGGVVTWLAGAGLTNRPNLSLKSLNTSQQENNLSDKLKALMSRLLAAFSLPDTTDEDALLARVTAAAEAEKVATKVAQSLSLPTTATADQVVKAVNAATTPDATKFVPMAQYTAIADQLKAIQSTEGDRVVGDAVKAGKILPAQKDFYLAAHARDPKGTADFLEKQPVVLQPGTEETGKKTTHTKVTTLTAEQKAICATTGVSEADYIKTLNEESL